MTRGSDDGSREPLRGEVVSAGAPGSVQGWAELLVARAREDGVALTGEGGLLTDLMRHVLQTGLEVEMADHLGYGPHERTGSGNTRNGAYDKTVTTRSGCAFLAIGPARSSRSRCRSISAVLMGLPAT